MHHRFDDSSDDYDLDLDQRTRSLGRGGLGGAGRAILLSDGREAGFLDHDVDGDIDMEDQGEAEAAEEKDLEEQVKKGPITPRTEINGAQSTGPSQQPAVAAAQKAAVISNVPDSEPAKPVNAEANKNETSASK